MRITFGSRGGARQVKNPRPIHTSPIPPMPPVSSGTGPVWFDKMGHQLPSYVRIIEGDCCHGCCDSWACK